MKRAQNLFAVSANVIALLAFLVASLSICSIALIPETVRHGHAIDHAFSSASSWVTNFKRLHARLPSKDEFTAWSKSQPPGIFSVRDVAFISAPSEYPQEVTASFGKPVSGSYVLTVWRGEWAEYFASWRNASTVDSATALYSSAIGYGLVFLAVAFGLRALSAKCRPTSTSSRRADARGLS